MDSNLPRDGGYGWVGGKAGMLGVLEKKNPRDFKYIVGVGFFFSFPYVQVFQTDVNNETSFLRNFVRGLLSLNKRDYLVPIRDEECLRPGPKTFFLPYRR